MSLRKNILISLLLAIGYIMHQIIPGTIGNMKFDLMLSFIFVALFISRDFKSTMLTALLGGFITALTTTFPGGQIANLVDKLATCIAVYLMIKVFDRIKFKQVSTGIIAFIGTIISGTTFLYTALVLVGLPAPFSVLFAGIVLPTAVTNIFVTLVVYNAVKLALKATGAKFAQSKEM
ncbi:MAG: tryptophan transporter [Clostridiaceae bacterium]|nr:tryptophan transporter [Clostridiaceae bacterium]